MRHLVSRAAAHRARSAAGSRSPSPDPSLGRELCLRCAKHAEKDPSFQCQFDQDGSKKCSRCRAQKSKCLPLPAALVARGHTLLRLQRELVGPVTVFRREALMGKVVRAAARIRVRSGRVAREEAPPKGQEALAAANYALSKSAIADLAAIRCELPSFRASWEAEHKATRAFNQELLSALRGLTAAVGGLSRAGVEPDESPVLPAVLVTVQLIS